MAKPRSFKERLGLARRVLTNREEEVGFFVNYPYGALEPGSITPYPAVDELFGARRDSFAEVVSGFSRHLDDMRTAISEGAIPWNDGSMFPPLDVLAAYGLVRHHKPARVLEVGSGTSSHVLARALADNGTGHLTCIDPAPRREIESLDVTFERRWLRESDAELVSDFEAGDVLFIDSSHLMFPGFDTDIEFNRMFPGLPAGALVHVHDIFLPEDYPPDWFQRRYAEQNALMGWILSGYFEVIYPGYYVASRMSDTLSSVLGDLMPPNPSVHAGSIWLRKV